MTTIGRIVLIIASVTMIDTPQAHHGITSDVDLNAFIDIEGRLASISWVNPHVIIRVAVESKIAPDQQWIILADPPSTLLSRGLQPDSHTSFAGPIKIRVYPNKSSFCGGTCEGYGYELTDLQGNVFVLHNDLHEIVNQLN